MNQIWEKKVKNTQKNRRWVKQNNIEKNRHTHAVHTYRKKLEIEKRLITNHDKYLHNSRIRYYSFRSHWDWNQWMVFNTHVRTTTTTTTTRYSIQFAPFCSFIRFILAIKFINEICLFAQFYCGKVVWSGDGNLNAALWYTVRALAFLDSKQC